MQSMLNKTSHNDVLHDRDLDHRVTIEDIEVRSTMLYVSQAQDDSDTIL
jgi:hypothetical protein